MSPIEQKLRELLEAQAEHPVYPRIELVELRGLDACVQFGETAEWVPLEKVAELHRQRELRIKREKQDRFRYRCEPEMWSKIDLAMCRKRLEFPGVQLELLVLGGIRGSKTDFTHSRAVNHFFYTENAWVWGLHETESSSNTIQQTRVMEFFPPEMNPDNGKMRKDKHTRMSYSAGTGFTGSMFHLKWTCKDEAGRDFQGGGLFDFKFYKSAESTLQGAELTCAVSDELVPKSFCDTVRERLLSRAEDTAKPAFLARIRQAIALLEAGEPVPGPLLAAIYHGVHLIGFTPKEGYSTTAADFLDGAHITESVDAELLAWKNGKPQRVPRFQQPKKGTRLVAYLHTYDNKFKGNWPAMKEGLRGMPENYIRIIAYGDVSSGYATRYPRFNDEMHVVKRDQLPRKGSWWHIVDPAGDRNWFMVWALVCPLGNKYLVREWPQEGTIIPDMGDPGAWAVTSEHGKRNGDAGPGQEGRGWGFERYKREILRVEAEIGHWWGGRAGEDGQWIGGPPIKIDARKMDSRLGGASTPTHGGFTTIIESMADIGMYFDPASGAPHKDGDEAVQNALDYGLNDATGAQKRASLFVLDECKALLFMFKNYGDPAKPRDEACKDPRDCVCYFLLDDPFYIGERWTQTGGSGGY